MPNPRSGGQVSTISDDKRACELVIAIQSFHYAGVGYTSSDEEGVMRTNLSSMKPKSSPSLTGYSDGRPRADNEIKKASAQFTTSESPAGPIVV